VKPMSLSTTADPNRRVSPSTTSTITTVFVHAAA
jgi:hypothetical protein